jgi:hypothetical protein
MATTLVATGSIHNFRRPLPHKLPQRCVHDVYLRSWDRALA